MERASGARVARAVSNAARPRQAKINKTDATEFADAQVTSFCFYQAERIRTMDSVYAFVKVMY